MVLLLHGFPMFWWTWREHIAPLASAGFHVVAMDLRGYGGSDHPPAGYDPTTLARDALGIIRSLGETSAVVIGHGVGGVIAWTLAAQSPQTVSALAVVCSPHPRVMRSVLARNNDQKAALSYFLRMQLPFAPERYYGGHNARHVGDFLERYSHDPSWLSESVRENFQAAYRAWPTAHTAIEFHRWAIRSIYRTDGRKYQESISHPVKSSVLEIIGEKDPMILAEYADSSEYVDGIYQRMLMPTGHYPHEENPQAFQDLLLAWLNKISNP